jgi:DNA-binding NarL/FixJ family response regulator
MAFNLDPLQRGIADMIAAGMNDGEIAIQMCYSKRCARKDVNEVVKLVGAKDRSEAMDIWRKSGQWCGVLK